MKQIFRYSALALTIAAAASLGGCAKKQTKTEGDLAPQAAQTSQDTQALSGSTVRESALPPSRTEPPPSRTAAVEPAPRQPVEDGGLSKETTPGLSRIHFDYDRYNIKPEARDILGQNADHLNGTPGIRIRIEGHCDERGTTEYNLALGERRAKSAFQYLMDLGIDPNRMSVVSYGEESPLDPRHNDEAWSQNRRAEFVEIR